MRDPGNGSSQQRPTRSLILSDSKSNSGLRLIVAAMAAFCLLGLVHIASIANLSLSLDYNEGWNAYRAAAAMNGDPLYPDPSSFTFNNYPPVSFFIVGLFGVLVGDNIVAGRIVSIVAFLVVESGIFLTARTMGCKRIEASFATLLFSATLLLFGGYVGMNDPQLLGHALGLLGFVIVLTEPRSWPRLFVGALFLTLGVFTKHNLIVQPFVITLWLLVYDRPRAWPLIAFGAVLGLAGLLVSTVAFDTNLLSHLNSARGYAPDKLALGLGFGLIPLGVAGLLLRLSADRYAVLCALYALLSAVVGAALIGGVGVDVNAFFDAVIALSLAGGLALARLADLKAPDGSRWATALAFCLVLPLAGGLALSFQKEWLMLDFWRRPLAAATQVSERDIAFLRAQDGPALCETLALCYWAGKVQDVDMFNLSQQFATGRRPDHAFVALIDQGHFRVVQFTAPPTNAFSPATQQALEHRYRIARKSPNGVFLVPR